MTEHQQIKHVSHDIAVLWEREGTQMSKKRLYFVFEPPLSIEIEPNLSNGGQEQTFLTFTYIFLGLGFQEGIVAPGLAHAGFELITGMLNNLICHVLLYNWLQRETSLTTLFNEKAPPQ